MKVNTEPVALTGALTVVVNAVIALAIGFEWVTWTDTQTALVVGVWNAVVALILVVVVRSKVTPTGDA